MPPYHSELGPYRSTTGMLRLGQGGKGGGRGLAGRAGRPAGGGLLAAKVLLGRGLALGSAQSARKRALVAVYSCSRSTAGWWTVGSVLVDSDHLLSSYLRFAVHQVQIGLPLHLRTARAARRVVCAAVFVQNCVWAGAKGVQGGALDLSPVCNAGARACSRRPCFGAPAVPRGGLSWVGGASQPEVCVIRAVRGCGMDTRRRKTEPWCACDGGRGGVRVSSVVSAVGGRGHTGGGSADGWRCRGESEPCRATVAGKGKKMAAAVSYAPASWASGAVVPSSPCPSLARSARGVAAEPWLGFGVAGWLRTRWRLPIALVRSKRGAGGVTMAGGCRGEENRGGRGKKVEDDMRGPPVIRAGWLLGAAGCSACGRPRAVWSACWAARVVLASAVLGWRWAAAECPGGPRRRLGCW
uniref:Uncharacterized protein n=1 Tax=Sorghum bicolor TaxID=4558 RepID=Q9XE66_SORBI|nr:unknown [Sorghum bicolor]